MWVGGETGLEPRATQLRCPPVLFFSIKQIGGWTEGHRSGRGGEETNQKTKIRDPSASPILAGAAKPRSLCGQRGKAGHALIEIMKVKGHGDRIGHRAHGWAKKGQDLSVQAGHQVAAGLA